MSKSFVLSRECKKLGFTIPAFCKAVDIKTRKLQAYYETDPKLAERVFNDLVRKHIDPSLEDVCNDCFKLTDKKFILNSECKKLGLTVSCFSEVVGVSSNTLRDWCVDRPLLMRTLFDGFKAKKIISDLLKSQDLASFN